MRPNEPLYGDSVHEQSVPKIVKNYKSENSKKRFLRDTYGFDKIAGADEQSDIQKIKSFDMTKEVMPVYMKEYMKDFERSAYQTQPVDWNFGHAREYAELLNADGTKKVFLGELPTLEEQAQGVNGVVRNIMADDIQKTAVHTHYHPNWGMPSGADFDMANNYPDKAFYIAESTGDVTKYFTGKYGMPTSQVKWAFDPLADSVEGDDLAEQGFQPFSSINETDTPESLKYNPSYKGFMKTGFKKIKKSKHK